MYEERSHNLGEEYNDTSAELGAYLRPRLRHIESSAVSAVNSVAIGICWQKVWNGHTSWQMHTSHAAAPLDVLPAVLVSLHWKNVRGCLALSTYTAENLLAHYCGACAWIDLDDDLKLALLQDALDHITSKRENSARSSIHIEGWASKVDAARLPYAVEVQLTKSDEDVLLISHFLTDLHGLQKCALLCKRRQGTTSMNAWTMLPIPVTLELGWMDLPLAQLRLLQPQDVLLPDAWWSNLPSRSVCIRISPRLGITADVVNGHQLQSTSKVKFMEQEPLPHSENGQPGAAPLHAEPAELMEIPIRITFDLGECSLPLAELTTVVPGHIFDLGLAPERAVNVRMNGVRIGEGELVDIDGRIGVAVARMTPLRT